MPTEIADHAIDPARVSAQAVAVVGKLRDAGFDAYLVGGSVRDLLLGRTPKDFDIATSATPEDVREVFDRARLIGRRFRIAHVRMGREIIEVSTFRRAMAPVANGNGDGGGQSPDEEPWPLLSAQGMILRDNAYGSIDEDAFRRDFTVNALYYDPVGHVVLDYCGGLDDIETRTLRLIGDAEQRFREDPVRLLRAMRFAAKLDLRLHPDTQAAIAPTRHLLAAVPPARLFDEFAKLFLSGHAERAMDLLTMHGLAEFLMLPRGVGEGEGDGEAFVRRALANTDARLGDGKPVTPAFLLAAFLWHEYLARAPHALTAQSGDQESLDAAAIAAIGTQRATLAIPRRHSYFIRDVWQMQPLLHRRTAPSVARALDHRRFRAAYDFLMLRAEVDPGLAELAHWWTAVQSEDRDALLEDLPTERRKRGRRRRRRYRGGERRSEAVATAP